MTKREQRFLAALLTALMLCLTALPASAATSATAASVRLSKYTGTVNVFSSSGRTLSKRTDMLLYNGYRVETGAKSYAWINLDSTKLAKLNAVSKVEVRKSGKKLEVLLRSGDIFFNVSKPLENDEVLNVRTSTMIVGIRGTSGIIRVVDRWATEIYILGGSVQCNATDPVTGQIKTETLHAGDKAVATAYPQDKEGDKCDIILERFETEDIGGFVLEELVQDPVLCEDIYEQSGLDVRDVTEQAVRDRLEQDEQEMQDELDRIEAEAAGQESNVSSDIIWEEEQPGTEPEPEPAPSARPSLGGGGGGNAAPATYTLTVNYVYEDGVTEAAPAYTQQLAAGSSYSVPSPEIAGCTVDLPVVEGTMPAGNQTVTVTYTAGFRMPKTAAAVQDYMTGSGPGTYTLLPSLSGNAADNTLTVDASPSMIIQEGYTLNLSEGVNVAVASGGSLTVNGTLHDAASGGNFGSVTLTNEGTVTVNSSNTLTVGTLENSGILTVTSTGHLQVPGGFLTTTNQLINEGYILGRVAVNGGTAVVASAGTIHSIMGTPAVTVNSGTFTAEDSDIASITVNGGTVSASGGSIYTGYASDYAVAVNNGTFTADGSTIEGRLSVNGGTVTANSATINGKNDDFAVVMDGGTFVIYGSTINNSVNVGGGTFYASYGSIINGGSDHAVNVSSNGRFEMDGAEALSSASVTLRSVMDGRLDLYSGTVTNSGTGYAIYAENVNNLGIWNTTIQAKNTRSFILLAGAPWVPDGYAAVYRDENGGCYQMVNAGAGSVVYGSSGDIEWTYDNNGTLTVYGTGIMDSYQMWEWYSFLYQVETVAIDGRVNNIDGSLFSGCTSLTSFKVADDDPNYSSIDGVLFSKDKKTIIAYPAGKEDVVYTIPSGVTGIGDSAFASCGNLTDVTIPSGVTSIEDDTFDGCSGLTSVTIPNRVQSIGTYAFSGCSGLTGIFIPVSVTSIGNYAFSGCSLDDVYYGGPAAATTGDITSGDIYIDGTIAEMGFGNDGLTNARWYYNSTGLGDPGGYALRSARAVPEPAAGPFSDVRSDAWYGEAVRYVYENGLMDGTGGGKFSPDSPTSRGMLVTILHRMEGEPAASGAAFPDVPDGKWYTDAVAWAGANGIVTGYDNGNFGPDDPLKREQLAAILYRYAVYKGYDTAASGDAAAFPDGDRVSAYAADAMNWAVGAGLIQGSDGLLLPGGGATRAQTAMILSRFCEDVVRSYTMTEISAMDIMCEPSGILFLEDGTFLVTDTYNKVIWQVAGSSSSVYAGGGTVTDPFDQPMGGYNDAGQEDSHFRLPWAIVPFLDGYAVSDADNNAVRLVRSETIHTVNGIAAEQLTTSQLGVVFDHPTGLAADEAGNLYVSDTFAGAVRKISPTGRVTTFVEGLNDPMGLCWKDGTLYIAETGANRIVKTTGGRFTVVAGSGEDDFADGPAAQAAFSSPQGVAVGDDGTVYVSDTVNGAVRQIRDGTVTTLAVRDESDLETLIPASPVGLAVRGDKLYVCDSFARKVFVISPI